MRTLLLAAMSLGLLGLLGLLGAAPSTKPVTSVESLAFLRGTWVSESGDTRTTETWTSDEGGLLLGTSKTVREGHAVFFEYLRIERDAATGGAVYVAMPRGQNESKFPLKGSIENGRAVFENAAHDFPQRIIYAMQVDGTLVARIEGTVNGKERSKEWTFTQQK